MSVIEFVNITIVSYALVAARKHTMALYLLVNVQRIAFARPKVLELKLTLKAFSSISFSALSFSYEFKVRYFTKCCILVVISTAVLSCFSFRPWVGFTRSFQMELW